MLRRGNQDVSDATQGAVVPSHGFFAGRRSLDLGAALFKARNGRLLDYVNLPPFIGMIVSDGKATLHELQSVYGVRDLFDLAEVISVDAYNRREIDKQAQ